MASLCLVLLGLGIWFGTLSLLAGTLRTSRCTLRVRFGTLGFFVGTLAWLGCNGFVELSRPSEHPIHLALESTQALVEFAVGGGGLACTELVVALGVVVVATPCFYYKRSARLRTYQEVEEKHRTP